MSERASAGGVMKSRLVRPGRLDVMLVVALVGVGVAAYLTKVGLDPERAIACGPLGNCHTVQSSQYAKVGGVPVAAFGLGMYVTVVALLAARRWWRPPSMMHALGAVTFAITLGGTLYSAYLTYLELFVIDAICAWCVVSAALVTVLFALSIPDARAGDRNPAPDV